LVIQEIELYVWHYIRQLFNGCVSACASIFLLTNEDDDIEDVDDDNRKV